MTLPNLISEKPFAKTLRVLVGIALAIVGVMFFFGSCFSFIMTLFMGGLAFLVGAGGATDEQIRSTGLVIVCVLLYPFAWTYMIIFSAINILLRKRAMLVIVLCLLSIVNEAGIFMYMAHRGEWSLQGVANLGAHTGWKILAILIMVIPFAGIIVAMRMRRMQ